MIDVWAWKSLQVSWSSVLGFIIYRFNRIKSETIVLTALEVLLNVWKLIRSFWARRIGGLKTSVWENTPFGFDISLSVTCPLMTILTTAGRISSVLSLSWAEEMLPRSIQPTAGIQYPHFARVYRSPLPKDHSYSPRFRGPFSWAQIVITGLATKSA